MSDSWERLFSCKKCGKPLTINKLKGHQRFVILGKCPKGHEQKFTLNISDLDSWIAAFRPHFLKCVKCDNKVTYKASIRGGLVRVIITCPVHGKNEPRILPQYIYDNLTITTTEKLVGTPCPTCGTNTQYIPKFSQYYCFKCDRYITEKDLAEQKGLPSEIEPLEPSPKELAAPPKLAPPVKVGRARLKTIMGPACPVCKRDTMPISRFSRFYCENCNIYTPDPDAIDLKLTQSEIEVLRPLLKNFAATRRKETPFAISKLPKLLGAPNISGAKIEILLQQMINTGEIAGEVIPKTHKITLIDVGAREIQKKLAEKARRSDLKRKIENTRAKIAYTNTVKTKFENGFNILKSKIFKHQIKSILFYATLFLPLYSKLRRRHLIGILISLSFVLVLFGILAIPQRSELSGILLYTKNIGVERCNGVLNEVENSPFSNLIGDKMPTAEEIFLAEWANDWFPQIDIPIVGNLVEEFGAERVGDIDYDNRAPFADLNISSPSNPSNLTLEQCKSLWNQNDPYSFLTDWPEIWILALENDQESISTLIVHFNLTYKQFNCISSWLETSSTDWMNNIKHEALAPPPLLGIIGLITLAASLMITYLLLKRYQLFKDSDNDIFKSLPKDLKQTTSELERRGKLNRGVGEP